MSLQTYYSQFRKHKIVEGRCPERKKEVGTSWEEIYKNKNANTKRTRKLKGLREGKKIENLCKYKESKEGFEKEINIIMILRG